jgi:Protein of unknown function (DUF2934)
VKHKSPSQSHASSVAPQSPAASETSRSIPAIVPSQDDIARRAYISYVNEGSQPGHQDRHWLEAEAHLQDEMATGSGQHSGSTDASPMLK